MDFSSVYAVVLAGGAGTRFWPASTPARPKQLLPLASQRPMIEDTAERILPLIRAERLFVLTGRQLGEQIIDAVPVLGSESLMIEPKAAGTGPVLAWAAHQLLAKAPEAVMVSLHADHVISPAHQFRADIQEAVRLAGEHRRLVTLGVRPTRPETGYGYICSGEMLPGEERAAAVDSFKEKPALDVALRYTQDPRYLWNSGMFVWRCQDFLDEVRRHSPEIGPSLAHLDAGDVERFFSEVTPISVDEAVLERSERIAVLPVHFRWDDVGTWDSLQRTRDADAEGNVRVGDAHLVDCHGVTAYAEDGPVVAFGLEDLVIVRASGITFVTRRDLAPELKRAHATLPERLKNPSSGSPS